LNCVMQWILACEFMFKENASSKFSKSIPSFPRQNKRNWHTIAVQDRFTTKIKMFSVLGTDWILFKNFKCCLNIYKHCCNWITAIGKNYSATTSNNVFHVECSFEANGWGIQSQGRVSQNHTNTKKIQPTPKEMRPNKLKTNINSRSFA
jgi:hypothetical protein